MATANLARRSVCALGTILFCVAASAATSAANVAIKSPKDGATLSGTATIRISGAAAAPHTNLYIDGQLWGSKPVTSWSWDTTKVPNGPHVLTVTAFTSKGKVVGTRSIGVTVSNPSDITITSPPNGTTLSGSAKVGVASGANAAAVNFYVDGTYQGQAASGIWSWDTANVADGPHSVSAAAVDSAGNPVGTSQSNVTVSNSGASGDTAVATTSSTTSAVTLSAPSSGATVSGTSVAIAASVSSSVLWVDFYVDKKYVKSSPPFTVYWNSTTVPNGSHTISVSAFNSSSSLIGTQSVGVNVSNSSSSSNGGAVTITSPTNGSTISGDRTISLSMSSSASWSNVYIDGAYFDSTPPLSFDFPTTRYSNGTHSIVARAYSSAGSLLDTSSISVNVSNTSSGKAPDLFPYLGPGSSLPSGSTCSNRVSYSSWEPRPQNSTANHTVPTSSEMDTFYADESQSAAAWALPRVTGGFTGTTDEVLQWASCKWGIETDLVRAIAENETGWLQSGAGDIKTNESLCPPGTWNGTSCPTSYGIMQVKYPSFHATWPMSHTSTPFNVDYALAYDRACIEGKVTYLKNRTPSSGYPTYPNGTASQMLWGCVGSYYSGGWYDSGALLYISHVKTMLADKAWLTW